MVQDERLNLTVFFRSHDMTQGWPENAYGCAAIQKEIANGIGVEPGLITIISGSAQIYAHYYQQVNEMLKKYYKADEDFIDPRGNYTIEWDKTIIVKHLHPENHKVIDMFEGSTAKEVYTQIARRGTSTKPSHLMYLGAELMRAELLKDKYKQDED
jgi:hypothetical protein